MPLGDVNLNQGFVRVTGKGNKTRLVPVGSVARDKIARYLEVDRPAWVRDPAHFQGLYRPEAAPATGPANAAAPNPVARPPSAYTAGVEGDRP